MRNLYWLAPGLGLMLGLLTGCITPGTSITIDSPANGANVERNKETRISATATDAIGVTRIELWDEGVLAFTAKSTVPEGQSVLNANFGWTPKDVGTRILVVKAYNRESSDKESQLAVLTLQVQDTGVVTTPTLTATITLTPASSVTPTRSVTPGPSPSPSVSSTPTVSPTPTTPPTGTPAPIPSPPSNLTATGNGTTIQFSWIDNSIGELGFKIYQTGIVAPVADNIPVHVGTGGMAYDLKNLPCNTGASFTVKAFNAQGESAASNSINAFTIPCAPSNLSVSATSSTSINLAFTNNGTNEAGYRIYQTNSTSPLGTITAAPGVGDKSGSLIGLACGTTAAYFARAYNAAGESSNSNTSEVTTLACNVKVTFTQVHIIDDSNPKGSSCGGLIPCSALLFLDFTVNTQAKRFPATSNVKATTGDTLPLSGIVYTFNLVRSQNISLGVNGTDQHSFQPNHPLGTITKTLLGSDNWGAGSHTDKSTCPGGCYDITYTIEVAP